MTFGVSIRHALYAVIELARADEDNPVSVASIAQRHNIPETALAKVFQRLVHTGLVVGMRGPHGGYRLARPSAEISVLDVVRGFEPAPDAELDSLANLDSLKEFFDVFDEQVRKVCASVTIDRLAANNKTSF